jgi:hypothetical protein
VRRSRTRAEEAEESAKRASAVVEEEVVGAIDHCADAGGVRGRGGEVEQHEASEEDGQTKSSWMPTLTVLLW